ncbi:hypothetical protein [Hyphomicrobium sp. 2TAF46]|uniref:hypothetical protein n=1 Tax=Hyphomicrobium sp. 2TAF46 TaxID=3233019 RepID=UPI003F8E16D4
MTRFDGSKTSGSAALKFLSQFDALFERTDEFTSILKSKGFAAYEPLLAWDESYAQNTEELAVERHVRREQSKENFRRLPVGMLDGMVRRGDGNSPFLEELRQKRDAQNGCSERELDEHFPSREAWVRGALSEVDRRRRIEMHEVYETKRFRALDEAAKILKLEAVQHATDLSRRIGTTVRDRCEIFRDVAERQLQHHGFKAWMGKGDRVYPIVSKRLNSNWELRWAPEKDLSRLGSLEGINDTYGIASYLFFEELYVCQSKLSATFQDSGRTGELFRLQYHGFVPFIWQGYNCFRTNAEFETAVRARASLIGLLLDNSSEVFERTFLPDE